MQKKYLTAPKRRIKKKFHRKIKGKYLEDESIKNFILQHSQKIDIDFSKIKIPSFLNCLKEKKKKPKIKIINPASFINILSDFQLPKYSVNTLNESIENQKKKFGDTSSLFGD